MFPRVITDDVKLNKRLDDIRSMLEKENNMTPEQVERHMTVVVSEKFIYIEGSGKATDKHPFYPQIMKAFAKIRAKRAARRAGKQKRNGGIRKKKECPVSVEKHKEKKVATSTNAKKD